MTSDLPFLSFENLPPKEKMVKLFCFIVGVRRSVFNVDVDTNESVDHLMKAVKAENLDSFKDVDADKLQLFSAKVTDGKWLSSRTEDVKKLKKGEKTPLIEALTRKGLELQREDSIAKFLANVEAPKTSQIHVLVLPAIYVQLGEKRHNNAVLDELTLYQERGELIQRNCMDYCQQILVRIDEIYGFPEHSTLPFICVEGSSGMGKSQLAFALGGSRPWFYWPTTPIGEDSQHLYRNFSSISKAFRDMVSLDGPANISERRTLDATTGIYKKESLWTYGFILALLKYSSEEHNQHGRMIRFQEEASLLVENCTYEAVVAFRKKMTAEAKLLPFFVLDDMNLDMHIDDGRRNVVAFQRNVFRVCGLVMVMMGTDATITKLVSRSPPGTYTNAFAWMTIIPRFPSHQAISLADDAKRTAWSWVQAQYPVLKSIVMNSRGLFARHFIDNAALYAMSHPICSINLWDLLDAASSQVSREIQRGKPFMGRHEGKDAQLKATSYQNSDTVSASTRQERNDAYDVGICCMHFHFANLMDHRTANLMSAGGTLSCNDGRWEPWCTFPTIKEDLLLYLAILGGKTYSGYYDHQQRMDNTTFRIFSSYWKRYGFTTNKYKYAGVSNESKSFENMVAHMIFCASRRNGVRGIPFDDFFVGLLGECRDKIQPLTMTISDTMKVIAASDLLDKYVDLADLSRTRIPFLAPPNAEWPQWILDTRRDGCNFGHLVRARNGERCDVYVCNMDDQSKPPLLVCECKHWDKSVDFDAMDKIMRGLKSAWKENWTVALVFCVGIATIQKKWHRKNIGCVKVDCQSCRVEWVFQPAEGKRKKLIIVIEMGSSVIDAHMRF